MKVLNWILASIVLLAVAGVVGAQFGLMRGVPPKDLGVHGGRLKPPSKAPNSVSSQADLWPDHPQRQEARIAPLALQGDGPATMARLRSVVAAMPGATVVIDKPDYLYVQFETRWMKYVDDAEFWFDPQAQVVHVRSASRIGRKDFGANRERIEGIRAALQQAR